MRGLTDPVRGGILYNEMLEGEKDYYLCKYEATLFQTQGGYLTSIIGSNLTFIIGIAISLTGLLFNLLVPGHIPSLFAVASSSMQGILWGLGTGCVVLGLINYQAPLARLVPLYNMNTLVTSGLALMIFSEWRTVNPLQLLVGAGLIIAGGILVSGA